MSEEKKTKGIKRKREDTKEVTKEIKDLQPPEKKQKIDHVAVESKAKKKKLKRKKKRMKGLGKGKKKEEPKIKCQICEEGIIEGDECECGNCNAILCEKCYNGEEAYCCGEHDDYDDDTCPHECCEGVHCPSCYNWFCSMTCLACCDTNCYKCDDAVCYECSCPDCNYTHCETCECKKEESKK